MNRTPSPDSTRWMPCAISIGHSLLGSVRRPRVMVYPPSTRMHLPGDVCGGGREEPRDRPGDVSGCRQPAERRVGRGELRDRAGAGSSTRSSRPRRRWRELRAAHPRARRCERASGAPSRPRPRPHRRETAVSRESTSPLPTLPEPRSIASASHDCAAKNGSRAQASKVPAPRARVELGEPGQLDRRSERHQELRVRPPRERE